MRPRLIFGTPEGDVTDRIEVLEHRLAGGSGIAPGNGGYDLPEIGERLLTGGLAGAGEPAGDEGLFAEAPKEVHEGLVGGRGRHRLVDPDVERSEMVGAGEGCLQVGEEVAELGCLFVAPSTCREFGRERLKAEPYFEEAGEVDFRHVGPRALTRLQQAGLGQLADGLADRRSRDREGSGEFALGRQAVAGPVMAAKDEVANLGGSPIGDLARHGRSILA
jgi:hypothetical protein